MCMQIKIKILILNLGVIVSLFSFGLLHIKSVDASWAAPASSCQESTDVHPASADTTVSTNPTTFSADGAQTILGWTVSGGAEDYYRIQVSSDPSFSSLAMDTGNLYPTLKVGLSGTASGCPVTSITGSGNSITINNQSQSTSYDWKTSSYITTCNAGTSVATQTINLMGATASGLINVPPTTYSYSVWGGITHTETKYCGISKIIASGSQLNFYGYSALTATSTTTSFGTTTTYTCSGSTLLGAITLTGATASGSTGKFTSVSSVAAPNKLVFGTCAWYSTCNYITITAVSPPAPYSLTFANLQPLGVYYWRIMVHVTNGGGYWVGPAWPSDSYDSAAGCDGTVPTNSSLCSNADQGLIGPTSISAVNTCTGAKCEYVCNDDYKVSGSNCVSCMTCNQTPFDCKGMATKSCSSSCRPFTSFTASISGSSPASCPLPKNWQEVSPN